MDQYKTFVERIIDRVFEYRREVMLGCALVVVASGSVFGYFWYKDHLSRQAHRLYAHGVELQKARVVGADYSKGVFETAFNSEEEKWTAVADAFGKAYEQYPHVGIGVMAGVAQAQAFVRLGKIEEARTLYTNVLPRITSPELRALYTLTVAQMNIDSGDESLIQSGVSMLAQLAGKKESAVHDTALYQLGLYYWYNNDFQNAQNYWNQLVMTYDKSGADDSVWVSQAQERLALLATGQATE